MFHIFIQHLCTSISIFLGITFTAFVSAIGISKMYDIQLINPKFTSSKIALHKQFMTEKIKQLKRPPFCVTIFEHQNVVKIISFISDAYLKHYKLCCEQILIISIVCFKVFHGGSTWPDLSSCFLGKNSDKYNCFLESFKY